MEIIKVDWVEETDRIIGEKESLPYTFFSLTSGEQLQYNTFRQRHRELEGRVRDMQPGERESIESKVHGMLADIIRPFIQRDGLDLATCFAMYGDSKRALLDTPYYTLFTKEEPFDVACKVVYWFKTPTEGLSCTSHLAYTSGQSDLVEREIIEDSLKRIVQDEPQDGVKHPMFSFRGDGIYFASTKFSLPIMGLIRNILEKFGKEAMEELKVLYREYQHHYNDSIKQKVFKEAYDRKLELELKKAQLLDHKLHSVK